jgi:hypothetical protein
MDLQCIDLYPAAIDLPPFKSSHRLKQYDIIRGSIKRYFEIIIKFYGFR